MKLLLHPVRLLHPVLLIDTTEYVRICSTVNSQFKKDINLQIHLHKAFFLANQFLDSVTLPKIHTSHQYLEDLE